LPRKPIKWQPAWSAERGSAERTAMGNPLDAIGHGIKVGVEDVGKGVAKGIDVAIVQPIQSVVKAEKVISTAIKDQPIVRDAVTALVKQANTVIADFKADIGDGFINLKADEQTLKDAEAFFNWFKSSFIPTMEQVYGDISAEIG
jgi:hypothetical protein